MIDPRNITNFTRTDWELEEFLIFSVLVAGKNAHTMAKILDKFLTYKPSCLSPLKYIQSLLLKELAGKAISMGIGCGNNKSRTLKEVADLNLDLRRCSVEDLEQVWGIGQKTSRFFIIHTRKNSQYAAIDTHIANYMGIKRPSSKTAYQKAEADFLKLAEASGMSVADFDLMIWNKYAKGTI